MSIKKKFLIVITLFVLLLIAILLIGTRYIIIPTVKKQEKVLINKVKHKIDLIINSEIENISTLSLDWADWDQMTNYIKKPNPEFEKSSLPEDMFSTDFINLTIILKKNREIIFSTIYSPSKKRFISLKKRKINTLINTLLIKLKQNKKKYYYNCIVNLESGPAFITISRVFNTSYSSKKHKTIGYIIIGKFLDKLVEKRIINLLKEENVRIILFNTIPFKFFIKKIGNKDYNYYQISKNKIQSLYLYKDMNEKPSFIVSSYIDNSIFHVINKSIKTFILIILIIIVISGFIIINIINKNVFRKLTNIVNDLKKIETLDDLSIRLKKEKDLNEISTLTNIINHTLEKLDNETKKRKKAERNLITNEKLVAIGRLSSNIAHEINSPLLIIRNSLEVIKNNLISNKSTYDESLQQAFDITEKSIERIREIIQNLIAFHKGKDLKFEDFFINEIVDETINMLKWSKKLSNIKFIINNKNKIKINGNKGLIKQLFTNLIINSAEAMNLKGKIKIEISYSDYNKFCNINFCDNGPGINDEIKKRIFEPFTSTKDVKGVGLGLFISYRIVTEHNGFIYFDENYNRGTRFIIKLPISGGINEKE